MLPTSPATPEASSPELAALRDRLASYCGVYLDDARLAALAAAVARRAAALGRTSSDYLASLSGPAGPDELQGLAELLLNHETQFFRNRPHLRALGSVVLPELHRRLPPGAPIKIWSAGCATGEEPYSLAIVALESLGDPLPRPVEILASDLSSAALARAELGVYRGRSLANLSPQQQQRFFTRRGESLVVAEPLRRLVRFARSNLLEPFPAAVQGTHVLFCQNVTIYFQLETCRALVERFHGAMAEGGALFLGFAETLWSISDRFRWQEVGGSYVYYKESQGRPALPVARRRPSSPAHTRPDLGRRARPLIEAGQPAAALELLAAETPSEEQAPQLLALAARAHADRGDLDLALAEARRAIEIAPLTVEARLLLGLIYARAGRPAEAARQLEQARYLDPGAPLIAYHLAECYRQAGRAAAARREYRGAIALLAGRPPEQLIDGVAVGWLVESCRRSLNSLEP